MWRAAVVLGVALCVVGCSKPAAVVAPQVADGAPAAAYVPDARDGLVSILIDNERAADALCRDGKRGPEDKACKDRDYAAQALKARGQCQDAKSGSWAVCPKVVTP